MNRIKNISISIVILVFSVKLFAIFDFFSLFEEHKGFHDALKTFYVWEEFEPHFDTHIKKIVNEFTSQKRIKQILDANPLYLQWSNDLSKAKKLCVFRMKSEGLQPSGSGGGKSTAIHLLNPAEVFIDEIDLNLSLNDLVKNIFLFHETYSSLGMWDENYQQSVGLWWLSTLDEADYSQVISDPRFYFLLHPINKTANYYPIKEKKFFPDGNAVHITDSGGTTSVGGAGDWVYVYFKVELLKSVKELFSNQTLLTSIPLNYMELCHKIITSYTLPSPSNIQYLNNHNRIPIISKSSITDDSNGNWQLSVPTSVVRYFEDKNELPPLLVQELLEKILDHIKHSNELNKK